MEKSLLIARRLFLSHACQSKQDLLVPRKQQDNELKINDPGPAVELSNVGGKLKRYLCSFRVVLASASLTE